MAVEFLIEPSWSQILSTNGPALREHHARTSTLWR
jgi:hypothetical protein